MNDSRPDVLIIGGGIGGLTLALSLHQAGVSCRVLESAPEIRPLGVGINLLPHAMRELSELGLQDRLAARAIETRTLAYYSRHGQPIISDTRGRYAGYDWPQLSIHRADLHDVLLEAARARLGDDAVQLDRRCTRIDQDGSGVTVHFDNADGMEALALDQLLCEAHLSMLPTIPRRHRGDIDVERAVAEAKLADAQTLADAINWLKPKERNLILSDRALLHLVTNLPLIHTESP